MTTATEPGQIPQWTMADRLRKARDHAGLSQAELADAIGVSRNSISSYETGSIQPRRIVLNAWSLTTGVPLAWITTGEMPDGDDGVRHQGLEPRTRWFEGSRDPIGTNHPNGWFVIDWPTSAYAA